MSTGKKVILAAFLGALFAGLGVGVIIHGQTVSDTNHSLNGLVCVTRKYILGTRARSIQAANDKTQSASSRLRAQAGVTSANDFLRSLITVPRSFNCSTFNP